MDLDELAMRVHSIRTCESSDSDNNDLSDFDEEYFLNAPPPEPIENYSFVVCEPFETVTRETKIPKPKPKIKSKLQILKGRKVATQKKIGSGNSNSKLNKKDKQCLLKLESSSQVPSLRMDSDNLKTQDVCHYSASTNFGNTSYALALNKNNMPVDTACHNSTLNVRSAQAEASRSKNTPINNPYCRSTKNRISTHHIDFPTNYLGTYMNTISSYPDIQKECEAHPIRSYADVISSTSKNPVQSSKDSRKTNKSKMEIINNGKDQIRNLSENTVNRTMKKKSLVQLQNNNRGSPLIETGKNAKKKTPIEINIQSSAKNKQKGQILTQKSNNPRISSAKMETLLSFEGRNQQKFNDENSDKPQEKFLNETDIYFTPFPLITNKTSQKEFHEHDNQLACLETFNLDGIIKPKQQQNVILNESEINCTSCPTAVTNEPSKQFISDKHNIQLESSDVDGVIKPKQKKKKKTKQTQPNESEIDCSSCRIAVTNETSEELITDKHEHPLPSSETFNLDRIIKPKQKTKKQKQEMELLNESEINYNSCPTAVTNDATEEFIIDKHENQLSSSETFNLDGLIKPKQKTKKKKKKKQMQQNELSKESEMHCTSFQTVTNETSQNEFIIDEYGNQLTGFDACNLDVLVKPEQRKNKKIKQKQTKEFLNEDKINFTLTPTEAPYRTLQKEFIIDEYGKQIKYSLGITIKPKQRKNKKIKQKQHKEFYENMIEVTLLSTEVSNKSLGKRFIIGEYNNELAFPDRFDLDLTLKQKQEKGFFNESKINYTSFPTVASNEYDNQSEHFDTSNLDEIIKPKQKKKKRKKPKQQEEFLNETDINYASFPTVATNKINYPLVNFPESYSESRSLQHETSTNIYPNKNNDDENVRQYFNVNNLNYPLYPTTAAQEEFFPNEYDRQLAPADTFNLCTVVKPIPDNKDIKQNQPHPDPQVGSKLFAELVGIMAFYIFFGTIFQIFQR